MQTKKMSLIIYNANEPTEKFTCLKVDEPGMMPAELNKDQMAIVHATCDEGPYLAFYRDWPNTFYTLVNRYGKENRKLECVEVVRNCLIYDETQALIVATILRKLTEKIVAGKK